MLEPANLSLFYVSKIFISGKSFSIYQSLFENSETGAERASVRVAKQINKVG
jgi:predicted nucleic acid-binding Zn ribbon protein